MERLCDKPTEEAFLDLVREAYMAMFEQDECLNRINVSVQC